MDYFLADVTLYATFRFTVTPEEIAGMRTEHSSDEEIRAMLMIRKISEIESQIRDVPGVTYLDSDLRETRPAE
jgi:hypothetical protein